MRAILAVVLVSAAVTSALAEDKPAEEGYSLQPAVGDYLKIDRHTGDVSLCAARDGVWSCQLIAEDRKAYEERIAELEAENDRLTRQVAELEARTAGRAPLLDKEDERRLQEFLDLGDRMFRHFFGLVEEFRQKEEKPI